MNGTNCATLIQVAVIESPVQTIYGIFQFFIIIGTTIGSLFAFRELMKCSILPNSTKLLLFGALFFANVHEFAHSHMPISIIKRSFFHPTSSCYSLPSGEDCTTTLTLLAMAINGNMCIQCALCLDRLLATVFPFHYPNLQYIPGFVLLVSVLTFSSFTFEILRSNYFFDDLQLYCIQWPVEMASRANIFLETCFYVIVVNIVLNIIIIKRNINQEMRNRFNVKQRYQTSETLKTTVVICRLSIFQFLSMLLYTVGVLLMRKNQDRIPTVYYMNIIIWLYAQPYACVSLPFLIIYSIKKLKKQRTAKIDIIVHQKESQDDHIAKLRQTWS